MTHRRAWGLCALLCSALLAGCGTSGHLTTPSHPSPRSNTGSSKALHSPPAASRDAEASVRQWMQAAEDGRAVGVLFADRQNIGQVQQAWGKASSQNGAGAGFYFTYDKHHAAFGTNVGDQIFDVRSFAAPLKTITLQDIASVLGSPGLVRRAGGTTIDLYPAGASYQLLWVFSGSDRTVSQADVVWPRGTVAQNFPNRSIRPTRT